MSQKEIKQICRQYYSLRSNIKIHKIDLVNKTFTIRLGDCMADVPLPKVILRELLINNLLTK